MSPLVVSAALMGLFGGAHCVTMCGGVSSVLCTAAKKRGIANVAYNAGRVLAYTGLGAMFGALGSLSTGVFPLDSVRFGLRAVAAVCMLAVGLHLAGLPSPVKALESIGVPLWRRLSPLAKRLLPIESPFAAVGVGMLWGLMPCGLLYGALALAASAESAQTGALTMAAFGLGTLPVMLTVGAAAAAVARAASRAWVRRVAGAVVLAFGLWSSAGLASQVGMASSGTHHCCPTR